MSLTIYTNPASQLLQANYITFNTISGNVAGLVDITATNIIANSVTIQSANITSITAPQITLQSANITGTLVANVGSFANLTSPTATFNNLTIQNFFPSVVNASYITANRANIANISANTIIISTTFIGNVGLGNGSPLYIAPTGNLGNVLANQSYATAYFAGRRSRIFMHPGQQPANIIATLVVDRPPIVSGGFQPFHSTSLAVLGLTELFGCVVVYDTFTANTSLTVNTDLTATDMLVTGAAQINGLFVYGNTQLDNNLIQVTGMSYKSVASPIITTSITLQGSSSVVQPVSTAGTINIVLPTAVAGLSFYFVQMSTGTARVEVNLVGSQFINGTLSNITLIQNVMTQLVCTGGTNWYST